MNYQLAAKYFLNQIMYPLENFIIKCSLGSSKIKLLILYQKGLNNLTFAMWKSFQRWLYRKMDYVGHLIKVDYRSINLHLLSLPQKDLKNIEGWVTPKTNWSLIANIDQEHRKLKYRHVKWFSTADCRQKLANSH